MDKLVDHLFIFEGSGVIRDYPGNYTQFRILEKSKQSYTDVSSDISSSKEQVPVVEKTTTMVATTNEKKAVEKLTYKEKLELADLDKNMSLLEAEKAELSNKLNNPALNYEEIIALSEKLAKINLDIETAELRWLSLSEKQ